MLPSPPLVHAPSSTPSLPSFITANELDVGQLIGKGGFASAVYRARCRHTRGGKEQHIALKIVDIRQKRKDAKPVLRRRRPIEEDEEEEESDGGDLETQASNRLSAEIKVHNDLLHPSIVEMLTWFRDDRFAYIALELCEGGDLHAALRAQGPFSEAYVASLVGQIVSGVMYLHETCGIVHRDLKLSNILLSGDGRRAKISDFGLAADISGGTMRRTLCGTPNYMAPEVALRQPYGSAVDLWSIGCLIFAMFIGRAPFQGKTAQDTLRNVIHGVYDKLSIEEASPEAGDAVISLLDTDPMNRLRLVDLQEHPFLYLPLHHETPVHSKKDQLPTPIQGLHSSPDSIATTVVSPVYTLPQMIDDNLSVTTNQTRKSYVPRCFDATEDLTPSTVELSHLKQHEMIREHMPTKVKAMPLSYGKRMTVEKQEKEGQKQQSRERSSDTLCLKDGPFSNEVKYPEGDVNAETSSTSPVCSSSDEYFGQMTLGGGYDISWSLAGNNGVPRRRRKKCQKHIPRFDHSIYSRGRRYNRRRRVGVRGRRKVVAVKKCEELNDVQESQFSFTSIVKNDEMGQHNQQRACSRNNCHSKQLMTTPVTVVDDYECRSRVDGGDRFLDDTTTAASANEKVVENDSGCTLRRVDLSRLSPCTFSSETASFCISPGGSAVVFTKEAGIWLSVSAEGEIHVGAVQQKPCPSGMMSAAPGTEVSAHAIFTVPDTVKCYSRMELPITYHAVYRLLEKAVQTVRAKTPKVTLRFTMGQKPDEEVVVVTATLMANPPLPDFRVVWADHTALLYSLSTGEMELKDGGMIAAKKMTPRESQMGTIKGALQEEQEEQEDAVPTSFLTLGESNNSTVSTKWVAEEGWTGSPPSMLSAARLSFAQKALFRCLHEERAAVRFPLELRLSVDEIDHFSDSLNQISSVIDGAAQPPNPPLQGWDDHLALAMRALEPPGKMPPLIVPPPVLPLLSSIIDQVEEYQHEQSLEPHESGSLAFIGSDAESIVMLSNDSHNEEDKIIVVEKSHDIGGDSSLPQSHLLPLPVAVSRHEMSDGSCTSPSTAHFKTTLPIFGGSPQVVKGKEIVNAPEEQSGPSTCVVVPGSNKSVKCPENKSTNSHTRRNRRKRREGRIWGVGVASKNSHGDLNVKFEDGAEITVCHNASWVRYRQASTGVGRGNASVDVYDLTKRSKLPHVLRSRMKYLPDFIAALKEAYRQPTVAS